MPKGLYRGTAGTIYEAYAEQIESDRRVCLPRRSLGEVGADPTCIEAIVSRHV